MKNMVGAKPKLSLHRETLRSLSSAELRQAIGGIGGDGGTDLKSLHCTDRFCPSTRCPPPSNDSDTSTYASHDTGACTSLSLDNNG
jgi:hypothetical protein